MAAINITREPAIKESARIKDAFLSGDFDTHLGALTKAHEDAAAAWERVEAAIAEAQEREAAIYRAANVAIASILGAVSKEVLS